MPGLPAAYSPEASLSAWYFPIRGRLTLGRKPSGFPVVHALVTELEACAHLKSRGVLLAGPSGTGKELAAAAVAGILGRRLHIQNAARYTSEDEAAASLFGVNPGVFSSVDERKGYIEAAEGDALFLDEVHALQRLQRSLLRIVEDNTLARIGETQGRPVDVKFIFATNRPGSDYGLEPDLLARLSVVTLKPLQERLADIPDIFSPTCFAGPCNTSTVPRRSSCR